MKKYILVVLFCSAVLASAETSPEVEQLKADLRNLQESFQKAEREHQRQIEELTRRLESLAAAGRSVVPTNPAVEEDAMGKVPMAAEGPPAKKWSPSDPITLVRSGNAYMNVGFNALLDAGWSTAPEPAAQLQLGDHDPSKRGFSIPNTEIALDGAVDPYFKGFANILFKLDAENQTQVELEEAFLQTTSLPGNLQLKAGQFLAAFGRQNTQHPHQWAFADTPLILARTLGPEGLRNPGAQVSWLAPTSIYTEASLGIFDGAGGTAFGFRNPGEPGEGLHGRATTGRNPRGPGDLLYVPRLATSIDLTEHQTLLAGVSAAFGPNDTGASRRTEIFGADLYWKWRPSRARGGFPFVAWQTEALLQNFQAGADAAAGLPAENLRDWGVYSQVIWGFRPRWVAGLRGEYADGNVGADDEFDVFRGERHRISPAVTFYPSEFSKIRLQYNYDRGEQFGTQHSVWLQVEFLLGAHGSHQF